MQEYKLGKSHPHHDDRLFQLANYIAGDLPKAPTSVDLTKKISVWPMLANDTVGDCTCAAAGHTIHGWTANVGSPIILSDKDVLSAYSAITGYSPSKPGSDRGAQMQDVLKYWRKTGVGKHRIGAYAGVEPGNFEHIKLSVNMFGVCYLGVALPISAQRQNVWSVPPGGARGAGAPGSWGGHAITALAYDHYGVTVVTWGALKRMTWAFLSTYADEAYAVLSADWINGKKQSPTGFDFSVLQKDLSSL